VANPCYPYIAFPTGVKALQPAWGGCTEAVYNGFYDPPYVLSKVSAMAPPSSPAQAIATTTPQVDPTVASRTYMLTPVSGMGSVVQPQQPTASPAQPASSIQPAIISSTADKVKPTPIVNPLPLPSNPADPTINAPVADTSSSKAAAGVAPGASSPVPGPGILSQGPAASTQTSRRSFASVASNLAATGGQPAPGGVAPVSTITAAMPQPAVTLAGQAITVNPTGFTVGTASVMPNGPAVTVSGVVLSMGSGVLHFGSSTILMPVPQPTANSIVLTANEAVLTATPIGPNFIIASQTLSLGGPAATVSGIPISLVSAGLIVGTATIPGSRAPQVITLNGQTITANSASDFVLAGQTLVPGGPPITVSGTPVSLGAAGTDVVVGTSTESVGLGGLIISGFGGMAGQVPATTGLGVPSSNITFFVGEGGRVDVGRVGIWMGLGLGVLFWVE
jgi:hypothetical protein